MQMYIQSKDFEQLQQLFVELHQLLAENPSTLLLEKDNSIFPQIRSELERILAADYPVLITPDVIQIPASYPKAWLTELDYISDYLQEEDYEAARESAKLICGGFSIITSLNSFGRNLLQASIKGLH